MMKKHKLGYSGKFLTLLAALLFVSSCTKTREASLPDDDQQNIIAISDIPTTSLDTPYSGEITADEAQTALASASVKALDYNSSAKLSAADANVPGRLKFMFEQLPVINPAARKFKITFSIEKDYVTAYKVVQNLKDLNALEKAMAVSIKEVELLSKTLTKEQSKNLNASLKQASTNKMAVQAGTKAGSLLVPLFRYKIEEYGILQRTKNELKESTSVLTLKKTDWSQATHIKVTASADSRMTLGLSEEAKKGFENIYTEDQVNNKVMTAAALQSQLKFGMKFVDGKSMVFTRLDNNVLHIYEMTTFAKLNELQQRLLKNQAGNQEVLSCSDKSVSSFILGKEAGCVLVLKADLPIEYAVIKTDIEDQGSTKSLKVSMQASPQAQSSGLLKIAENSPARQVDVSGVLDPDSTIKISDLNGEFFYRRTFESASNIFLGRTGTSGDMTIIRFELQDSRIVVRNQQSLIIYTGQGPLDREELMSFPVTYFRMTNTSAEGSALSVPVPEKTTKEKAEYAKIDWTANTIPDSNSPLAFYSGGRCINKVTSQKVTDTDMRLAKDGVLNFSLSGSYTVEPQNGCVATKEVNSAYWGGSYQFNFNISERISFMKHKNVSTDKQFSQNISSMAQSAFNFGVFTLADKVKGNNTLDNRDGSEKYMPIIHDFRNGKKLKYYVGGLNNATATPPARKKLIVDATKQVIDEWNRTLRFAFRGTSLERAEDYVEIVIDDGPNPGHLGDLDRNYIWYQELEAENGLLGVAQPAANPRAGTIESANVIIYSGNTYDQTNRLLQATAKSRAYEKQLEATKKEAQAKAAKAQAPVAQNADKKNEAIQAKIAAGKLDAQNVEKVTIQSKKLAKSLDQSIKSLQLDKKDVVASLKNSKMEKSELTGLRKNYLDMVKEQIKGQVIDMPVNEKTFLKVIADKAMNQKLTQDPRRLELELNNAFIKYGQLDVNVKEVLQSRTQALAALISFDENMKNRPGCMLYSRNEINDEALEMDKDPQKNFELNFKKNIMSTLSHELGHAFGLLHNFKASIDKANYEFEADKDKPTGRNYSSIMDYIGDIDMKYAGPGPYDAHAIRAAYTGLVELSESGLADPSLKPKLVSGTLIPITDLLQIKGLNSFVHLTKDTVNKTGLTKYYEQCDDGGLGSSSLCAQFDSGGSALEIVQNYISDYNRGYLNRNYVYDKIIFGWTQKIEIIQRNVTLFQNIRRFLDEAFMSAIYGVGRPAAATRTVNVDLQQAATLGYTFFHELLRTPDASGVSVTDFDNRLYAVPYSFKVTLADAQGNPQEKVIKDVKIIEARSAFDVSMTREKFDTIGIGYDKLFAMQFLMQSSVASTTDDSVQSRISYLDFEKAFLGVKDASDSTTLITMLDIMTNNLNAGFFVPADGAPRMLSLDQKVLINRSLSDQTTLASIISLAESKWKNFDPFAETFKVSRASGKTAPKDRPSVARAGQDRKYSDTRVYFASQNAVGAALLVKTAARDEAFLGNRLDLFELLKNIYQADIELKKPILALINAACAKDPADEACKAISQRTYEQHVQDHAELAPLKQKADAAAQQLIATLRELNSKEAIMAKNLDKADSPTNFSKQVDTLRVMMGNQVFFINDILTTLQNTKADQLQATIQTLQQKLSEVREKNAELAQSFPLLAFGQMFIAEISGGFEAQLQTKEKLTGDVVANAIFDKDLMQDRYDQLLKSLEELSFYTGMIDPDTVIQ